MKTSMCVAIGAATAVLPGCVLSQPENGGGERADVRFIRLTWRPASRLPQPVAADLPDGVASEKDLSLVRLGGDNGRYEQVPCQRDPVLPRRIWWVASPPRDGETEARYALQIGPGEATTGAAAGALAEKGETDLRVVVRGRPVVAYRHAPLPPPKGKDPLYARSGFIHPLWSPTGHVLTAIHPADHIHHMGIWNPWTSTEFEGRHVDFWNVGKGQGTVRFSGYESVSNGPVFAGFRALQEHVDLKAPGGPKSAIHEVFDVRVWDLGAGGDRGFLIDFVSTQRCASDSPITLNAYRYGGLGFRAHPDWAKGDYLTSEGKTRKDGHGSRGRWCHAFGPTPTGEAGILFMSHPGNREHPEPMRLWPKGHIFFNFCPIQKKAWTLEPGIDYVLRYRLHVYDGKPSAESAEHLWQQYSEPPRVEVLPRKP